MTGTPVIQLATLSRIVLNAADPAVLARFYAEALGFAAGPLDARDAGEGEGVRLTLGPSRVDLVASRGRPYPGDVPGWSPHFQHLAIVVSDMPAAMTRLSGVAGWRAISTDGPERLPERSGGVSAFKFRDPEGHPLEFLAFPPGTGPELWRVANAPDACLGIDHSAISVAETARSVAFYRALGLTLGPRSLNTGPEQARLDAIADPQVEVTGLMLPGGGPPHLELLCYRGEFDRAVDPMRPDDIAATRLVFTAASAGDANEMVDPDGHRVEIEAA